MDENSIWYKAAVWLGKFDARLDPKYRECKALALECNVFSVSHLQRNKILGYRRACRILERINKDLGK